VIDNDEVADNTGCLTQSSDQSGPDFVVQDKVSK
jgi:hypothetical protein